jgi:tape measure domain-containing protein
MATIKNTITLQDKFTPVLRTMIKAMDSTVAAMAGVDKVSNTAFNKMKKDVQSANEAVNNLERDIRDLPSANNGMNNLSRGVKDLDNSAESVGKKFSNWGANLGGAIYSVKAILNTVSNIATKMDEINTRSSRTDMVANLFGGVDTGDDIRAMVQDAAQSARGNAALMTDVVSKMGIQATEAFSSPKELVDFNEQLQKTFVIAGTSSSGVDSTMYNLVQALSTGILRGQDLNAVMSNTPQIIQNIAKYMGVSMGEVRKLAEAGEITAEVVKYAMLSATEQTNEAFNSMPMTFQAVTNMIKTDIDNFLQPLAEQMSGFWSFIADNWSIIQPILIGITVALGALAVGLGIAAIAQWALNSAMLANPMTWVIVAIVALIAVIVILAIWIIDLWKTNMDFKYGVIKIWNDLLNFFDQVPIFFQWVANGIADAFGRGKVQTLNILQDMANGAIDIINGLIRSMNKIPKVSIDTIDHLTFAATAAVKAEAASQARADNLQASKDSASAKAAARQSEMMANRAADEANLAAKKAAAEAANNLEPDIPTYEEYLNSGANIPGAGSGAADIAKNGAKVNGGKLDSVGSIKDDVSIADDDLKLLKDIAIAGFTQQYTKLQPNLKIEFSGDVRETADVGKIMIAIEEMVEEAYASSLVGEGA